MASGPRVISASSAKTLKVYCLTGSPSAPTWTLSRTSGGQGPFQPTLPSSLVPCLAAGPTDAASWPCAMSAGRPAASAGTPHITKWDQGAPGFWLLSMTTAMLTVPSGAWLQVIGTEMSSSEQLDFLGMRRLWSKSVLVTVMVSPYVWAIRYSPNSPGPVAPPRAFESTTSAGASDAAIGVAAASDAAAGASVPSSLEQASAAAASTIAARSAVRTEDALVILVLLVNPRPGASCAAVAEWLTLWHQRRANRV